MPSVLAPAAPSELRPGGRPDFSVVIPVHQAAATIGAALDSLRAQTVRPAEIVVCDDGSTDGLEEALTPYREEIRLIRQEHRGVAAARNALLRTSSGDFVVPLDADDTYMPERLERLGDLAAARPDLDLLGTDASFIREGREVGRFYDSNEFAVDSQEVAILESCFLICPAMRRERLLEIGGYDEALGSAEDWDACVRLIESGSRAGIVEEPLLEYRLGSSSLTSGRVETLWDRVRMLEKALADPQLSASSRRAAETALSEQRARAQQRAAREASASGDPSARQLLLEVARSGEVPLRARVAARIAAVSPSRSRRLVAHALSDSTGRPGG